MTEILDKVEALAQRQGFVGPKKRQRTNYGETYFGFEPPK
jgi:hypothetical protein